MISITSDIADLILQRTLNYNTLGLNNAIERMTTGYKVNHAKDNAAGYSIITDLSKKISSMLQVQQNTETGIDLLMTAEGGMAQIHELLERLRELSTQAANGNYNEQSRDAMQAEADAIIEEIERIKASMNYNGMNLYETPIEEETQTYSIRKSSRAMALAANTNSIEGAIDFNANETKTVTIDNITYTIKNSASSASTISYIKDTQSGEITFLGNSFTIRGQLDVSHNIKISGNRNYIYGGDLDDTITSVTGTNLIYGGKGNDTLTIEATAVASGQLHGEDGDDILIMNATYQTAFGGNGNDTFYVNAGSNVTCYGEEGDDTFHVKASGATLYGDNGEDHFNIISGTNNIINGGEGTNSITGNTANNTLINVPGATSYELVLNGNEVRTQTINGIDYKFTNHSKNQCTIMYSIENDGTINFFKSNQIITIEGAKDKAHKVKLKIASGSAFYGGDLDDIIIDNSINTTVYGGKGNDNITIGGYLQKVYGEDGDDTINANGYRYLVDGGNGNDNISLKDSTVGNALGGAGNDTFTVANGITGIGIDGGEGNNTISSTNSGLLISGFGNLDNATSLSLAAKETKVIEINGIQYTIKNNTSQTNSLLYSYNDITNEITFAGTAMDITGQKDKQHNVIIYGASTKFTAGDLEDTITSYIQNGDVYAGAGNDIITNHGVQTTVYGEDGDDVITQTNNSNVYGGKGNDTFYISGANNGTYGEEGDDIYYINGKSNISDTAGNNIYYVNVDNISVSGGANNDTFYISGNNNIVLGGGGDDYFIIDGDNNTIDGGTGNNLYIENGQNTTMSNVNRDPNSGGLSFTYLGEVKTFTLNNKTYTVTNDYNGNNQLTFSLNPNTGVITLQGNNFTIDANANESAILNIRGDNNTINGSNLADKITVEQGSNNIIHGKDGDDTLISNSENNSIFGDNGNDNITINASSNLEINGGDGNDTININSSNSTNINAGNGEDRIIVNGENNTVNSNEGNNNITINQNSNTITTGNGNNKITTTSDNNNITAGYGENTIGVQGNNNNITSNGNTELNINGSTNTITTGNGNDDFTIKGNENNIQSTGGDNEISLKGNDNVYQGGAGIDNIKINGDRNFANGGEENDKYIISSGNNNVIDGEGGRNTMINNGVQTIYTNVVDITPRPFELKLNVDICTTDDKFITTTISFNLFDFSVDFSTQEGALEALEQIDELISNLNAQLTNIGSVINRLETVLEAQSIKLENMISTRSTLQDADIAKESSSYIRYQILQQASSSLMSTSRNMRAQSVLGLLYGINR